MKYAKKIECQTEAWELGTNSKKETELIERGLIKMCNEGHYEMFSQEVRSTKGEVCYSGDFFKMDSTGQPYPICRNDFLDKHIKIDGDWYRQISEPLPVWTINEPICPEIQYLIDNKILAINWKSENEFYSAKLWGTIEKARKDSYIVFYSIERGESGFTRIDFNFVEHNIFNQTYRYV